MNTLLRSDIRPRAIASLALMLLGAAAFALTPQDSWIALTGLLASLGGLALLYRVIRLARVKFTTPTMDAVESRGIAAGCGFALLRAALILAALVGAITWVWFAANDMNEIRLLLMSPRYTNAQTIGREIVRDSDPVGYVHYAYRVSPTLAPEDRFAVPHGEYKRFWTGLQFEVTYAASAPRVHRVGHVGWDLAVRRTVYWLLLLANGAAYVLLPLWLMRFRKRAAPERRGG